MKRCARQNKEDQVKSTHNYLDDIYTSFIYPKLCSIDVFLKSVEDVIPSTVAKLLDICEEEVLEITGGTQPTRASFLSIMERGSSFICGLYRRELECGSPHIYSAKDIAYIYQLDYNSVQAACSTLGIADITPGLLPQVLAMIEV